MPKPRFKSKELDFKRRGDHIEVKLMDEGFHTFYKKNVGVHNKKDLRKLITDLDSFGINLSRPTEEWFD